MASIVVYDECSKAGVFWPHIALWKTYRVQNSLVWPNIQVNKFL